MEAILLSSGLPPAARADFCAGFESLPPIALLHSAYGQ
jgi:hypothetical protein